MTRAPASVPSAPPLEGELFRALVDSVLDYAIFMLTPDGRIASWNPGAERIEGYQASEVIGRHCSLFYPEAEIRAGTCELELEVAARDGRFEKEGWRLRKDGTRFWAHVVISAMRDDGGDLRGFSEVTRDLTARRLAQEEQLASHAAEERFRILVESVHDYAIFMLDAGGHVQTWNQGAQRINQYADSEIIGKHFSAFYPQDDVRAGKCEEELMVAARDGRFEEEGWRIRKDGTRFWASVVIGRLRDAAGTLIGFSKVTRDLTERRHAEEQRTGRLIAEQASRAKDEFLAILGHELRNPMAPILTALQLMRLRGPVATSKEQEVIERQVRHMMHLVDDMLDMERITRGKIALKKRPLDLREVVAQVIEVVSPLLEQRRHHFTVDLPPGPILVEADEVRLAQALANLLTNAAKYTDEQGHVDLAVRLDADQVVIEVRDDGFGIDAALLPMVFDVFVQGRQSPDRGPGGLGLGLALVRALVDLHGGQVSAASAGPGTGSTFTVRLPALGAPAAAAEPEPAPPVASITAVRPRRVLVVDDNEDGRVLLEEALVTIGHQVTSTGDPIEALALARSFDPEVIVLDIGLPGMDGYEVAARVRAAADGNAPRLIALTGYGQPKDIARSREAGFDDHLVKPVDLDRLFASILE